MAACKARALGILVASALSTSCAASTSVQAQPYENTGHRSYVLPVVEIAAMNALINLAGRELVDPTSFTVTPASIRRNLREPWVVDDDPFQVNQIGHPYQGAMYHGIARSNGLGYWPSVAYTFAGSAVWEIAGETTPPSRNDQIASGVAGSFLGEPLFRIARLLVDRSDRGPGVWRTLASVLASPPTGINHMMVGNPAGSRATDAVPFSDIRVQFGASALAPRSRPASALTDTQPQLLLSMDYGYPGNASYRHERPFDYFRIEGSVSNDGIDHVSTRGLIAGGDYGAGRLDGIWGVYGGYDYFTPDHFRFSSTAASFGTTLQAATSGPLVVQSSALVGAGYAAAQVPSPLNNPSMNNPSMNNSINDERDFHYGIAPQALVNLRVIAGRRAALDVTAREYFVSALGGFGTGERDYVFFGDASLAVRVYQRHAVGLTYQRAHRSLDQAAASSRVGVFYTFLGSGGFGAVSRVTP